MNYYYNAELSKTFIVCGFTGVIKIYDLARGDWYPKEFKTKSLWVSSLEIFEKKVKVKNEQFQNRYFLLVGLGGKKAMFYDLSSYKKISSLSVPNTKCIHDISILNNFDENGNQELALIACQESNSIKLVTKFKNLKITEFSKDFGEIRPINFRKVLIKDQKTGFFVEHLVILGWESQEKNQVLLF